MGKAAGMLEQFSVLCSQVTEAIAAVIIGYAVIELVFRTLLFVARSLRTGLQSGDDLNLKEAIRLRLGTWLALALEVLIAADILKTVVAPTWQELGQLAAIIVLRIVLNFFLQRDIDAAARRGSAPSGS